MKYLPDSTFPCYEDLCYEDAKHFCHYIQERCQKCADFPEQCLQGNIIFQNCTTYCKDLWRKEFEKKILIDKDTDVLLIWKTAVFILSIVIFLGIFSHLCYYIRNRGCLFSPFFNYCASVLRKQEINVLKSDVNIGLMMDNCFVEDDNRKNKAVNEDGRPFNNVKHATKERKDTPETSASTAILSNADKLNSSNLDYFPEKVGFTMHFDSLISDHKSKSATEV